MAKVAVITGSNGLIGQADLPPAGACGLFLAVGIDIGAEGTGNWPHYACDLSDLDRLEATLAAIEREHGLIRVLFNNAGVYHPQTDFLDVPPAAVRRNAGGQSARVPFFASQWVAKRLIAAGETGAIVVNTASSAGQRGSTVVEYGASKAAVINLTKSLGARGLAGMASRVNAHRARPDQHRDGRAHACRLPRSAPRAARWGAPASRRRSPAWSSSWKPATPRRSIHLRNDRRERRRVRNPGRRNFVSSPSRVP